MLRKKTPIGKLEEQPNVHPAQEKDPLPAHPDGVNPTRILEAVETSREAHFPSR